MKFMFKPFFSVVLLILSIHNVSASVTISINQQKFEYEQAPRLADAISPIAFDKAWYWPASRLYKLQPSDELPKQQVLTLLNQLQQTANHPAKRVFMALAADIQNWQIAERISIAIDYDLARANPALNPRFESGVYQLNIETRPDYVLVVGAINSSVRMAHKAATPVKNYILKSAFSEVADKQRINIIQPNGKVIEVGVQHWNAEHIEVMPGSIIFVPFAAGLYSSELAELNKQLLALLVNRIY
ncbi:capsule biosynthesis GfcC family protein [Alishewanella sp. 16-MA]|uniref:Capsule biosynthesis GfcC family protein n=1 Tax=Alishewanella maricola TaxID=2795740 RepID=A0ABS8C1J8_9ALTE|nr:capsule biosynthesis GfcC family protein [Alishewanella maricola]MCB5226048.1 capsule biosynthesis GfcC family protein [Alishewanella maricola]